MNLCVKIYVFCGVKCCEDWMLNVSAEKGGSSVRLLGLNMVDKKSRNPYYEPQPFCKSRVDPNGFRHSSAATSIDRENVRLHKRLKEIQRKPSKLLQPSRLNSCSNQRNSVQQPWGHQAVPSSSVTINRKREDKDIQQANLVVERKLKEAYKIRQDSFVVRNKLGSGVDCNPLWQHRTSLYRGQEGSKHHSLTCRPHTAPSVVNRSVAKSESANLRDSSGGSSSSSQSGGRRRPTDICSSSSPRSSGVPKTLAVAACAGNDFQE